MRKSAVLYRRNRPGGTTLKCIFSKKATASCSRSSIRSTSFENAEGYTVEFHETDASDYVRSFDKEQKARNRNRIRDELTNVGVDVLQRRVEHAKAQSERLPPPRMTFNEFKAGQLQPKPGPELSFKEMSNRARAFKMATLEEPPAKQTLSPDRATRMLKLASENMWREIISKLSAEDALEVAEKITEDAELRDALVKHSLEAP
jgi:hypothetical protein